LWKNSLERDPFLPPNLNKLGERFNPKSPKRSLKENLCKPTKGSWKEPIMELGSGLIWPKYSLLS